MKISYLSLFTFCLLPLLGLSQNGVTAWESIGIRIAPDKTSQQIGTVRFGTDIMKMTDEKEEVEEDKKQRTYLKVVLADGTEGWINDYLIIPNGEGAVIIKQTPVFKNPKTSNETLKNWTFEAGDPVIKTDVAGDYAYIYSERKEKKGWVPLKCLAVSPSEVKVAMLLKKALAETDEKAKMKSLQNIRNMSGLEDLKMVKVVERSFQKVVNGVDMPDNPDESKERGGDEVAEQPAQRDLTPEKPAKKDSVKPKPQPPVAQSKPMPVANNISFVPTSLDASKISADAQKDKVQAQNQHYWKYSETLLLVEIEDEDETSAFRCYHNYLPEGTKILVKLPEEAGFLECMVVGGLKTQKGLGFTAAAIKRIFGENPPAEVEIQFFTKMAE